MDALNSRLLVKAKDCKVIKKYKQAKDLPTDDLKARYELGFRIEISEGYLTVPLIQLLEPTLRCDTGSLNDPLLYNHLTEEQAKKEIKERLNKVLD